MRFLQIRAKQASSGALLAAAEAIVRHAEGSGALIVVNDRADVARLAGAGGVHVGQDDLPAAQARAILGPAACVGLSTHTLDQIARGLQEPVDYLAIGPVFGTATKATGYEAVGLNMVTDAAAALKSRGLPLVAIGGITLERATDVLLAGATSVAVISDLFTGGDSRARIRQYLERLAGSTSGG